MKIAVVGTGYVGLVTGTCLAETGNDVFCVDIDREKVEKMRNGVVPIYEPYLNTMFDRNVKAGRLRFTTELAEGIEEAEIVFLALPTPPGADGSADLKFILQVADQLGGLLKSYKVIVDKSTVPVGTAELVAAKIKARTEVPFDVVSNPEFLREGFAVEDFMKPDRIVIGTQSQRAQDMMTQLFKPFVRQGNPILFMDERSAELTKYAANAFLATKITFMNEIANFCEKVGADVDKVRIGIGTDDRIGRRFLFAGIGYGGSCFPKDVQALQKSGMDYGYDFQILDSVIRVNEEQKTSIIPKMKKYFGSLKGRKIALWGLAFKPDTDDIREAPSLYIIDELLKEGASVKAFDPEAMPNVKKLLNDTIEFANDPYAALEGADALVIATEWSVFRNPDFEKMGKLMAGHVIFDGRNLFELAEMEQRPFFYSSIGRRTINA